MAETDAGAAERSCQCCVCRRTAPHGDRYAARVAWRRTVRRCVTRVELEGGPGCGWRDLRPRVPAEVRSRSQIVEALSRSKPQPQKRFFRRSSDVSGRSRVSRAGAGWGPDGPSGVSDKG